MTGLYRQKLLCFKVTWRQTEIWPPNERLYLEEIGLEIDIYEKDERLE